MAQLPLHRLNLPPVLERLEFFTLYETRSRFYLVGANSAQTAFRVIKFDRLSVETTASEDPTIYDPDSLRSMLTMVEAGNGGVLIRTVPEAYGVLGVIRFLHGYYLCLITKIKRVGAIGGHIIYTIEDTALVSLTHAHVFDNSPQHKVNRKKFLSQESRYKTLFSVLDLSKNFYFSYTYDITNTLQTNMLHGGSSPAPVRDMFVWNWYLITGFRSLLVSVTADQWLVPCIHGFFEQSNCSVFSHVVSLILISRRSRLFAGTRYLKRGLNDRGQVANEVETEQILHNREGGSATDGNFTSHVQLRASIPLFWSQESNAMIARPAIVVTKIDPVVYGPRLHVEDLFARYGSPLLVLNLVRQNERKERESIIGGAFGDAIKFLNAFLPEEHMIDYYAWDFKQVSKSKTMSVVDELVVIAHWALQRTGLFHSHPRADARQTVGGCSVKPTKASIEELLKHAENQNIAFLQQGVMRSNCIDSLDRTNVAQFCVAKCALGYQLYAMGLIESCETESSSEMVNILLDMYEHNGDCLAMQYGGSQMHRQMKKDRNKSVTMAPVLYRQKAPNKPKEMFVSLMRHYQNSFQDTSKQDAINVFLGNFAPSLEDDSIAIWDLSSDYYLHNRPIEDAPDTHGRILYENPSWYLNPIVRYRRSLLEVPNDGKMVEFKQQNQFLPQITKNLRFRQLYLPSKLTFFDEAPLDELLRIRCIRLSGVKSEMRRTFTQRLRNTLPTKNANKQEVPERQSSEELEFNGDWGGLEAIQTPHDVTGEWKSLVSIAPTASADHTLATLLDPYLRFTLETDLMVPRFSAQSPEPPSTLSGAIPSPSPHTPYRRGVSRSGSVDETFATPSPMGKSPVLPPSRESVSEASDMPSRRISLESPLIVAPTRRIIMISTLPASPEADDEGRERGSAEGWLGTTQRVSIIEEEHKVVEPLETKRSEPDTPEVYLTKICKPPDHSALENFWKGSPDMYAQHVNSTNPELFLKSTFQNPNADFWSPSAIQLNENERAYYETYLAACM